jgi:hypothetical protein
LANLRRKDQIHFGTAEGAREPIESVFWQMTFKPLVFGSFGEMSSNVRELIETAVEFGVRGTPRQEHGGHNGRHSEICLEKELHDTIIPSGAERVR